ncbi:katanin p80 WD40 repeat-containing subunit B1-like [Microplitis mediator]|uniref:katanin p80 WD40 repeat-containing subunit B1-like n=1 Tax=Microplitis mediator TaxID=375433 RepID=UPI002556B0E3|nr:katanin p80 WD40 repeat-containing subunit B1-like [Microplitis mediator]
MATSTQKSWKLQDFTAHTSNVKCLALGHKSGRVLVTGGDDKKVNLWAVGKQNCIMSLSGHTTAIECVRFGPAEDVVCSGSHSGALKIWDLEHAKLTRTFTGHKAGIKCMDFHPYGELLTSGSVDTGIKLWDIRKQGCVFTYRGHDKTVNSLKFSPDGQWIASAGEEGTVKLWDLRVAKLLKEFSEHKEAATTVEFHPHEFLLASGGMDKTVHFWDLESFKLVSSVQNVSAIRCLHFSQDGECLYTGTQDLLEVHRWEPARTLDTVTTSWGKVQDIAIARTQLFAASFNGSNVKLFVCDLNKITSSTNSSESLSPFAHGNPLKKSFTKDNLKKNVSELHDETQKVTRVAMSRESR